VETLHGDVLCNDLCWVFRAQACPLVLGLCLGSFVGIHSWVCTRSIFHCFLACRQLILLSSWFYSTENLFFSLVLPKGKEAELTGFFIYCTQILVWLPPLIFSVMLEANVNPQWGLMSLIIFFAIAIGILCLVSPWEAALAETAKTVDDVEIAENSDV